MGICILGVSEDGVWQPNKSNHIAVQSQLLHRAVVSETAVGPRLGKDDVDLVFLKDQIERHSSGYTALYHFMPFHLKDIQKHH